MKLKHLVAICLAAHPLSALNPVNPALSGMQVTNEPEFNLKINNRVLARPNGRAITVLDVVKRLEMVFQRDYPNLTDSSQARYQFYSAGWRTMLDELIDSELIMAHAEEKKIQMPDGEIRKELESMFGPNVVVNLDKLGLTFDEAWDMVKTELTCAQMKMYMVHSRAMVSVNPEKVSEAYHRYSSEASGDDEWEYQVLSIRHKDPGSAELAAEIATALLEKADEVDLEQVKEHLSVKRDDGDIDNATMLSVSDVEKRALTSLAKTHREILADLAPGSFSQPVAQKSRADGSTVYRIFHLVGHVEQKPAEFTAIEQNLKNHLLQEASMDAYTRYIERLRRRHGINEESMREMIPADFQPFQLN